MGLTPLTYYARGTQEQSSNRGRFIRRLGRTIGKWRDQIVAWHRAHVSNGPTEAINTLIKRLKRTALVFRQFKHYRISALLYAAKPNWSLLNGITPPEIRSATLFNSLLACHQRRTVIGQGCADRQKLIVSRASAIDSTDGFDRS